MPHVLEIRNVRLLRHGHLIDKSSLWVRDGKIIAPSEQPPDEVVDGKNAIVAPGFIDIQVNGGFGVDFSSPEVTQEDVHKVQKNIVATGVTSFCPTLVSSSKDFYPDAMAKFDPTSRTPDSDVEAEIIGLHLEGPFINKGSKGAHPEELLVDPINGIDSILDVYGSLDNVVIITLAPELKGSSEAIAALKQKGIVVSAGHSRATIKEGQAAIENGITLLTHAFNAMGSFHHRDPGLVGLLGSKTNAPYFGMVVDGHHSHPATVSIAQRAHPNGLILVTDSMNGLGLPMGEYELGGRLVDVTPNGAFIKNTSTLAGSIATMDTCARNLVEFTGCSTVMALESATLHPAQALGIQDKKGTLDVGTDADFVLLDDALQVQSTYVAGNLAYKRSYAPA